MDALEAIAVSKIYTSGTISINAVSRIDLAVRRGEFVAIVGASGSGKSTLLNLLGGIELPTSGKVLVDQVDLALLSETERTVFRRRRIGFVFQAFNLMPMMSALDNTALPLIFDGMSVSEARLKASALLQSVGMEHRADHIPSMLSGGEQQRIAIARALAMSPAVLMADEPTGNLDRANGEQIMKLLRSLVEERQHTVVVVTHDPKVANAAHRSIHVSDGVVASPIASC